MAYDCLKLKIGSPVKQAKEYLEILYLAARGTESEVDNVLRILFDRGESISVDRVKSLLDKNNSDNQAVEWFHQVLVKDVDLSDYDQLLSLSLSFSFPDAIATASTASFRGHVSTLDNSCCGFRCQANIPRQRITRMNGKPVKDGGLFSLIF